MVKSITKKGPVSDAYDACFIFLGELSNDARTLNLARTLVKRQKSVCVIACGGPEDVARFAEEGITLFPIGKLTAKRAYRRWIRFVLEARKYEAAARAGAYWAEDLYSLKIARKLKKKYKGRLFYDSRDIYSALGPLSGRPIRQKIITALENKWIKDVDEVIVSSKLDAEYLKGRFKPRTPFHLIMNLPPYREKVEADLFRKKYGISKDALILLYQGVIMRGRGLEPIIRALPHLEGAVLCVLGEGDYKAAAAAEAEKAGVADRVFFHGKVPYDELHEWTSSADIGVAINEPISFSYEMALPNKLFEYCMARIPSIVSDLPALRATVKEHGIGTVVPAGASPEETAKALSDMTAGGALDKYRRNCEKAVRIFSYETQEDMIISLVEKKD